MQYIIKNKENKKLLERFYDSVEISMLQMLDNIEKASGEIITSSCENDLSYYRQKYSEYCNNQGRFGDYWWVKKGYSFNDLAKETDFHKSYIYKDSSERVHLSFYNSLIYVGKNKEGILIGHTYDGVEKSGFYSMLCFIIAMSLFDNVKMVGFDSLILRAKLLLSKIKNE